MTDDKNKKRILFVDDDPAILAGLRNVFQRDRDRWDLVFAQGGDRALEELGRSAFDVVVSDMKMPDMDGVTFLERVRAGWPHTARLMLSGSATEAEIRGATDAVDELLSKPCDTATLRATLERMMRDR